MLETQISSFIKEQFPEIYRDEGPFFVEFVKQYYAWMESDETSPLYQSRHHLSNHDIDTTVDNFIVYFKEKYLKNIQLNTATNTKQLIKNSIDLYRSKGTENGIRLFFDLIFSAPAEVYYPGEDVFKLSGAQWKIPAYIEVESKPINRLMVGRQIYGVYSGAVAFVEKLVRRKVGSTFSEIFYISAVNGEFSTGEVISLSNSEGIDIYDFPHMIGSLTSLSVVDGGDGFARGDLVSVRSATGAQGKALVTSLSSIAGLVSFNLIDGGWGYTVNSSIYVSNTVLQLSNVQLRTSDDSVLFTKQTNILQPQANVQWYDNTASFSVGETVFNYEANGDIRGISKIVSAEYGTTNTSNYFLLSTSVGNSAHYTSGEYTMYKAGNTENFKVQNAGWVDKTASGILNGVSSNIIFNCIGQANSFSVGEEVYQINSNNSIFARGKVYDVNQTTSNTFILSVNDIDGMFLTNFTIKGLSANGNVSVNNAVLDIGIRSTNGTFISLPGNILNSNTSSSLFSATVIKIPFGSGASVGFDTNLTYTEDVELNTNFLRDHSDDDLERNQLNAASYGVLLNDANVNTALSDALTFETKTIGTIVRLKDQNPGSGYSYNPFVIAEDPLVSPLNLSDFVLSISNASGVFAVGELVTQNVNSAQGIVKFANSSTVRVKRITYQDRWSIGTDPEYLIVGSSSGFNAKLDSFSYDIDGVAGKNAIIDTDVNTSNSSVATLKVVDSGFNYRHGQSTTFTSIDGNRSGTALASVITNGRGSGYYKSTSGFLSSDKYLYDGDYYQDFSYDIRSPITVDLYSAMLKNILHVAGTKSFASILKTSLVDSTSKMYPDVIETSD